MNVDDIVSAIENGAALKFNPHGAITVKQDHLFRVVSIVAPMGDIGAMDCAVKIKRVIFNPPATIVFWSDGTKTVVKCSECSCTNICKEAVNSGWCLNGREQWQRKGVIAAMLKKAYGRKAPSMLEAAVKIGEFQEGGKNG